MIIRGTVSCKRHNNKQYTNVMEVLEFYSNKYNIEFRSNNKAIELAEVMSYLKGIINLDSNTLEIKERLK